jgi:DNA-directed RNA polymerase specialized sigma subunit
MALFGYKKMTLKELSAQYGISQPGIKQMNDRIISYIRSDEELLREVKELCLE